ncbi:MAG: orotidine-5'-phosphate decarboxylase [bacterium]|nr:orotidine-5'-phosphate decarboxylase [bacterium]
MTREDLISQIREKQSFLCVGLDTDPDKIPAHLKSTEDPIFEFNKQIIDATKDYCVAYKPNLAFYEAQGISGWQSLQKTLDYIPSNIFTIADAKRGDIGNTSKMYGKAFFEELNFDSLTVAPYMGEDSITPYFEFKNKWVILLGATSNPGAMDFQDLILENSMEHLYEHVIKLSSTWGTEENMMYVVGATRPEILVHIRSKIPNHFLLIPGVGAQGGDLAAVCKFGMNKSCGLLINSSRSIIYAGKGEDFAEKAGEEAKKLQTQMTELLAKHSHI